MDTIRIRLGHESLDVTLAYLKGKDAESEEAQEHANSSSLALLHAGFRSRSSASLQKFFRKPIAHSHCVAFPHVHIVPSLFCSSEPLGVIPRVKLPVNRLGVAEFRRCVLEVRACERTSAHKTSPVSITPSVAGHDDDR